MLGKRLKRARQDAGLSLARASQWSGVHPSYIAALESGKNEPRVSTLVKLCDAYGVTASEMIGDMPQRGIVLTERERAVINVMRGEFHE